jgi:hypothetical protein
MTSVPKPLKFLRPQYEVLKAAYEQLGEAGNKRLLSDVLSLLAMTGSGNTQPDTLPDSLRFRLLGSDDEIGSFGHEVRAAPMAFASLLTGLGKENPTAKCLRRDGRTRGRLADTPPCA